MVNDATETLNEKQCNVDKMLFQLRGSLINEYGVEPDEWVDSFEEISDAYESVFCEALICLNAAFDEVTKLKSELAKLRATTTSKS